MARRIQAGETYDLQHTWLDDEVGEPLDIEGAAVTAVVVRPVGLRTVVTLDILSLDIADTVGEYTTYRVFPGSYQYQFVCETEAGRVYMTKVRRFTALPSL